MADVLKILGQIAAAATTEEDLYNAPNLSQVTCSTLAICNRTAGTITFRISMSVDDAATATKDYLFYDAPLEANSTLTAVLGITLGQNDTIRTYASTTGLTFTLLGVETS